MLTVTEFLQGLKSNRFCFYTGVPCSFFQSAINAVIDDPELEYVIMPNEGSALSAASGAHLAGNRSVVMIQNSGLGNLVNPLTSLNMIYRIPVLLFISGRAYGIPDEPQHEVMGKTMGSLLDAIGIQHEDLPDTGQVYQKRMRDVSRRMEEQQMPFAFFVTKGTLEEFFTPPHGPPTYPLTRIAAIRLISECLKGTEFVVSTTGKPSRELFTLADRKRNFYMQGSMGHVASMGLGLALSRPNDQIVVMDGDGSLLMHLGVLSSVGHYKPKNFYHIVLDNESYETTGDQDTTSKTTDIVQVAKACGYRNTGEISTEDELKSQLPLVLASDGPVLIRVKVNRLPSSHIPRITTKYRAQDITRQFRAELAGG